MSELSINDRAAIAGKLWKPGQRCANKEGYETFSGFVPSMLPPRHNARCLTCGWKSLAIEGEVVLDPHDIPAPDMIRPENYMRALENIAARGGGYALLNSGSDGPSCRIWLNKPQVTVTDDAPMAALAALYDAEHPEE